jgi:hypothetical protein
MYSQPTIYTGYVSRTNGVDLVLDAGNSSTALTAGLRHQFDLKGTWVELLVPVRSTGRLGLAFGGGYLFATDPRSTETYTFFPDGTQIQRTWATDIQWANCQVACTLGILPSLTGILGFRYDSFLTNFRYPENNISAIGDVYDVADLTFAAYIPYFGLLINDVGMGPIRADIGVVGFPTLLGSLDYHERIGAPGIAVPGGFNNGIPASNEFRSGHFIEAFGECSVRMRFGQIGAFGKYGAVYGRTFASLGERNSRLLSPNLNFTFERRNWIFGGKISVDF